MFTYDSVHGRFQGTVEATDGNFVVNGRPITVYQERDPAAIQWGTAGADYVIESSGVFTTIDKCVFCGVAHPKFAEGDRSRQGIGSFEGWCQEGYYFCTLGRCPHVCLWRQS